MPPTPPDGDDRIVVVKPSTVTQKRHQIVGRGFRYYRFRVDIAYSQARPTQIRLPRETNRLDCSGLVACCMDYASVMPRVDWRYTNTWVQIRWGKPVLVANAKPGDVVFYGRPGDPSHEALYLGTRAQVAALDLEVPAAMTGAGRWVLSHGHYPMGIFPLDYRGDRIQIRRFVGETAT